MDIYFVNSCAQTVALAVLMAVIFRLRKSIGSRGMFIGFEVLLLTIVLRRIDEIGVVYGVDVFDRPALAILTWIVIFIFMGAFIGAWRRRMEIQKIEEMLRTRNRYQEALRQGQEALQAGSDAKVA